MVQLIVEGVGFTTHQIAVKATMGPKKVCMEALVDITHLRGLSKGTRI